MSKRNRRSAKRLVRSVLAGATAALAIAPPAAAQTYPAKPIRMLVGFPPGGGTDIVARLLSPKIVETFGQQIIIENRPGATGTVAAGLVAKASPDGYTLLMGHVGTNAVAPSVFPKLPFDPVKDFAPITLAGSVPHFVLVHPSFPAKSVKELIAIAKARPGQLTYPSAGNASSPHLAGELFKSLTKLDLLHVPYKGTGQSMQDLLGGQHPVAFDTMAAATPYVKSGQLRALAVSSAKRHPAWPAMPTAAEAGVAGYEITTWYALFAPAGTPRDIVARWHAEVNRVLGLPEMQERLLGIGDDGSRSATPEAFAQQLLADIERYGRLAKSANIRVE
jgi:tripartite-type tricarboxylate transporter receptor subunit TctC